jgi:hypothetical protein
MRLASKPYFRVLHDGESAFRIRYTNRRHATKSSYLEPEYHPVCRLRDAADHCHWR